jgi:DNA-binding response OmpR family regulator
MNERQRIMVVDDDREMSGLLNSMLEREGFDTVIIADAEDAPRLLDIAEPDLVIMEITPREEDSLEVLDLIRRKSDAPIIVLSVDIRADSLQRALSHGADDYIRMPFGIKSFMARVRARLRHARENTPVEI